MAAGLPAAAVAFSSGSAGTTVLSVPAAHNATVAVLSWVQSWATPVKCYPAYLASYSCLRRLPSAPFAKAMNVMYMRPHLQQRAAPPVTRCCEHS
jgi:hypothetical protein